MLDFTAGKPWKLLLQFSIPLLISSVLQQMYSIVDYYIIGNHLGTEAMASVGTTIPIIFALVSFIIGITMGSTVIVSQYFGAKDFVNVKRSIDTTTIFLVAAALAVMVLGLGFCAPLLRLVKTPVDVFAGAQIYMQVTLIGLIPMFGINCLGAILRGLGDSKTPLYTLIISSVINIAVTLVFVVGMGWGISGAAWATVLSQTVTVTGMIMWLNRKHPVIKITLRNLAFDMEIFRSSIRIGLPNGVQQALVAVGMMTILSIVNKFSITSNDVLVAYSIVNRIDTLVLAPAMTFSIAIAAFVGQNLGAQKLRRIPSGLKATLFMSTAVTLVISAIFIVFATPAIKMFSTEITPEAIAIGQRYLRIVCSFTVIFSTMFVFNGVMRGAGDTLVPMFITLLSLWIIRIPVASFLSDHIGPDGIWWSIPIAWSVGVGCSIIYYRTGRWKTKGVVKPE